MKKLTLLLIISFCLGFISCNKDDVNEEPDLTPKNIDLTAKGADVIAGSNKFGVDLFVRTAGEENGNMMISPLSADPQETPVFIINKPFIFAIRERTTNTMMNIGQVTNPLD